MSRNNKANRKAKQKKKQGRGQLSLQGRGTPRASDVPSNASRLIERGSWHKALEILEDYDKAHPDDPQVLGLLAEVYDHFRAYRLYCRTCRRQLALDPDNRLLHLMLGGGYLCDFRPASALLKFREFVRRWPNDPLADGARKEIDRLEPMLEALLQSFPGTGDERVQTAAANEDIIACMSDGEYARVIERAEALLARIGDFPAVMNNLGEAYFQSGETDRAVEVARRVAELEPENFHALANLTRYLFFSGRVDDARTAVERLRRVQSERKDSWIKKCEALATLGDDEGVLAVFAEAEAAGIAEARLPEFALLFHLVAVAYSRQGQRTEAERWWRAALKIDPGLNLVRENLADASKAVGQRSGAWYFSLEYWGFKRAIDSLRRIFEASAAREIDEALLSRVREFVDAYPEFITLLPELLDRSDPSARKLVWMIAMKLDTPECIDALRTFCTSQWGPDEMRMETAEHLRDIGALSGLQVRMWMEGKWHTGNLLGFKITDEPFPSNHCEQVRDWIYEGKMANRNGNGKLAEELFLKCIELEGESPILLNNVAKSRAVQGRTREALQLARQIHERWPDYFFGRITMAGQAIADGDFEQAQQLLAPLYRRKQLHISEFGGLAQVHIELALVQNNLEAARCWLQMWEEIDPDNPDLKNAERRCRFVEWPTLLGRWLGRR